MELSAGYLLGLTRASTDRTNEARGPPPPPRSAPLTTATITAAALKTGRGKSAVLKIYIIKCALLNKV